MARPKHKRRAFNDAPQRHRVRTVNAVHGIDYFGSRARLALAARHCHGAHTAILQMKVFLGAMRAESAGARGNDLAAPAEDFAADVEREFHAACEIVPRGEE
jgi:hypothetical protein